MSEKSAFLSELMDACDAREQTWPCHDCSCEEIGPKCWDRSIFPSWRCFWRQARRTRCRWPSRERSSSARSPRLGFASFATASLDPVRPWAEAPNKFVLRRLPTSLSFLRQKATKARAFRATVSILFVRQQLTCLFFYELGSRSIRSEAKGQQRRAKVQLKQRMQEFEHKLKWKMPKEYESDSFTFGRVGGHSLERDGLVTALWWQILFVVNLLQRIGHF